MKAAGFTILFAPLLTGFVLLGKTGAKLPVSPEAPTVTFVWSADGKSPELKEKDKFKDGAYGAYSDSELTPILIQEAMDQWNAVRGSYLRFELETTSGELSVDNEDGRNFIVVKKAPSASVAAYASPNVDSETNSIKDCDIVINDVKTRTLSLLETITHELGHCVGLGHPHTNYGAIMSYSREGNSYRLSADDKAGAIYLYPDPNHVSDEPKELVGCSAIKGPTTNTSLGFWLYYLLALPLAISLIRRKNLAVNLSRDIEQDR
jgi:hypothetical protein